MRKETWKCVDCGKEIEFKFKRLKDSPLSKNCDCGGFWEFAKDNGGEVK